MVPKPPARTDKVRAEKPRDAKPMVPVVGTLSLASTRANARAAADWRMVDRMLAVDASGPMLPLTSQVRRHTPGSHAPAEGGATPAQRLR